MPSRHSTAGSNTRRSRRDGPPPTRRPEHIAGHGPPTLAGAPKRGPRLDGIVPFCPQCKSLVYPSAGKTACRKCGWTSDAAPVSQKISLGEATSKARIVLEDATDARPMQSIHCPKCGHDRAYFHLMQTRKSDEPPTQINECAKCKHGWREY